MESAFENGCLVKDESRGVSPPPFFREYFWEWVPRQDESRGGGFRAELCAARTEHRPGVTVPAFYDK